MCFLSWVIPVKLAPLSDNPPRMENQHSTWLSQEACVGVKWEMNVFVASQPAPALVVVRPAAEGAAVRQLEITLGAFERLDVRLLVDSNDQRTLRRVEIEPDNLGRLGGKLGILADATNIAPGQIDLLRPQETPDILFVHLAQHGGDQGGGPARVTGRRRAVEHAENTLAGVGRVAWCRTPLAGFVETGPALLGVAHPPLARRPDGAADRPRNRPRRYALGRQQHDPCPLPQPVLSPGRARQAIQLGPLRPPSKQSQSPPGCFSCTIESRLTVQR